MSIKNSSTSNGEFFLTSVCEIAGRALLCAWMFFPRIHQWKIIRKKSSACNNCDFLTNFSIDVVGDAFKFVSSFKFMCTRISNTYHFLELFIMLNNKDGFNEIEKIVKSTQTLHPTERHFNFLFGIESSHDHTFSKFFSTTFSRRIDLKIISGLHELF